MPVVGTLFFVTMHAITSGWVMSAGSGAECCWPRENFSPACPLVSCSSICGGGQGQPGGWYGENDLNVSGVGSVKSEIQTLFISPC